MSASTPFPGLIARPVERRTIDASGLNVYLKKTVASRPWSGRTVASSPSIGIGWVNPKVIRLHPGSAINTPFPLRLMNFI